MPTINEINAFLDVRNHGYLRVAAIVPRVHLGNPLENAQEHIKQIAAACEQGAQYVVCPELGLTGYSNQDLFFDSTLQAEAREALKKIVAYSSHLDALITVGLPLVIGHAIYNCAVTLHNGRILAVTPKLYPPEYREFYELRHFARASESVFKEIILLGQKVPFGTDILLASTKVKNFVVHVQICEDGWVPIPPSAVAVLAGATVVANVSASNITIDKDEYRRKMFLSDSGKWICGYIYCATGFGESTTDLPWDGDAFIADRGDLLVETKPFDLDGSFVIADLDLEMMSTDRQRQSSFHQNAAEYQSRINHFAFVDFDGGLKTDQSRYCRVLRKISPHPHVPQEPGKREKRCRQVFYMQVTALARRLSALPENERRIVIGVSGGQDSTQALLVATLAMDLMGLPRTNIHAITMPGYGSTSRTKDNALALMSALGVTVRTIPIISYVEPLLDAVNHPRGENQQFTEDSTFENAQARIRKLIEFTLANEVKGIDLCTGDLSEAALGWCTFGGDQTGNYAINFGVAKTLMTYLIGWAIDGVFGNEPNVQAVLRDILATPISPELKSPDAGGQLVQKTEDELGPYELFDFYIYYFVRFGFTPKRIARMALQAFESTAGRDLSTIKKYLEKFIKRFFINQYKRNCVPDGPKVGLASLSPRGDWRMPSDAQVQAWLRNIEEIPDYLG